MRKLTDQNKIDITARYVAGEKSSKLGREFGVSAQAIIGVVKSRGVFKRFVKKSNQ